MLLFSTIIDTNYLEAKVTDMLRFCTNYLVIVSEVTIGLESLTFWQEGDAAAWNCLCMAQRAPSHNPLPWLMI